LVAEATLAIAALTCSTAVACCLVLELDFSRRFGGASQQAGDFAQSGSYFSKLPGAKVNSLVPPSVAITVVLTAARISSMRVRISLVEPPRGRRALRISSATTANRFPAFSGAGGFNVALMARILSVRPVH